MASNDVFCLRLQDFDSRVRDSWRDIQSQKDFCDVTIACDDNHIETHKFMVSSFSPVLRNILKQSSNPHPFIYLRGVKYKDVINLLNFMYQGEVNIPQEDVNSFIAVAADLKIRGLSEDETRESVGNEFHSHQKVIYNCEAPSPKRKYTETFENEINSNLLSDQDNSISKQGDHQEFAKNGQLIEVNEQDGHMDFAKNYQVKIENTKEVDIEEQEILNIVQEQPISNIVEDDSSYICDHCEYKSTCKSNVKMHIKSVHKTVAYSCDQCDYRASRKDHVKTHINSVHERISYPCDQCNYRATQTSSLKRHIKTQHN